MRIVGTGQETQSAGSSITSKGRRARRPHQKSREGCIQCKDRHVKCNEVHPRCRHCQKMDIHCSFSAPAAVPASMPLNPESVMDLELLQYCHRRRPAIGFDSLDLGFTHHYLLNSILALAALQLHREAPSRHKWYARAVSHQQAALTRAKPHLRKLDSSESHRQALVAFSAFTSVYSAAEPMGRPGRFAHDKSAFNAVGEIIHSIRLSRASTTFVQQNMSQDLSNDAYLSYKYGKRQRGITDDLDEQFPEFIALRAMIDKYCAPDQRAICEDAAALAFAGLALNWGGGSEGGRPGASWDWSMGVDDAFLQMCVEENPAALVILAHYAALISTERDAWFLKKWPAVLIRDISRRLGGRWEEMEWPRTVVLGPSGSEGSSPGGTSWSDDRPAIEG